MNTKFAKSSILGKPVLQPRKNQSVVRQPTAFKSERPRILKLRFASQVDVNNDLSKLVTTHYLPKKREYVVAKPHHVIASSNSRNSSKNMPRSSSNDMVHNHYLEEAKNKTHDMGRNSKPSVMPSARSQSIANASKPKPRSNTQTSRNWHASKIGLRWVPTGKIFTSSTTKVDSEPPNGSNEDITNPYECEKTLDVSAGTLNLSAVQASVLNVNKWRLLTTLQAPFLKRKEKCTIQCALSSKEEKSSCVDWKGESCMGSTKEVKEPNLHISVATLHNTKFFRALTASADAPSSFTTTTKTTSTLPPPPPLQQSTVH
ncbi:hypothetical protein Tco_1074071 [Tanacetum coccineum]